MKALDGKSRRNCAAHPRATTHHRHCRHHPPPVPPTTATHHRHLVGSRGPLADSRGPLAATPPPPAPPTPQAALVSNTWIPGGLLQKLPPRPGHARRFRARSSFAKLHEKVSKNELCLVPCARRPFSAWLVGLGAFRSKPSKMHCALRPVPCWSALTYDFRHYGEH